MVADRWRSQCPISSPFGGENTYQRLLDLDKETASPEDVRMIIGNDSWTELSCDQCGQQVNAVIWVGQEPDYDSRTACICRKCLSEAMQLMINTPEEP